MPSIDKVTESKTGDGDTRVTTTFVNGQSTDVTYSSGKITVDDHYPDGTSKSYDGVKDSLTGQVIRTNPK